MYITTTSQSTYLLITVILSVTKANYVTVKKTVVNTQKFNHFFGNLVTNTINSQLSDINGRFHSLSDHAPTCTVKCLL